MQSAQLQVPVSIHDHSLGPLEAPVTLVQYGDFECQYSARAHQIIQSIHRYMGDQLRFVFRHFPVWEEHTRAQAAAEAAEAVGAQGKFWQMLDLLFRHQSALEEHHLLHYAALTGADARRVTNELATYIHVRKIREDIKGALRSGVFGTPTFFINGVRYDGNWMDSSEFLQVLSSIPAHAHGAAEEYHAAH
jgi:protein-disulfide isomerase